MNEELISIIVPVYNVEEYLERCVESILKQTYKNIEIILVDDGSKDNSGNICDKYAEKDQRIRVVHKENGGLSSARNIGIDLSEGEYISFIDSDDWIEKDMLEVLYRNIKKSNAEISIGQFKIAYSENDKIVNEDIKENVYDVKEALDAMYRKKELTSHICNKLYKKRVFEKIKFPIQKIYEDQYIFTELLLECEKVITTSAQFYYYYVRYDSISNNTFNEYQFDILSALEKNISEVENMYPDIVKYIKYKWVDVYLYLFIKAVSDNYDTKHFKAIYNIFKDYSKGYIIFSKGDNIKIKLIFIAMSININLAEKIVYMKNKMINNLRKNIERK